MKKFFCTKLIVTLTLCAVIAPSQDCSGMGKIKKKFNKLLASAQQEAYWRGDLESDTVKKESNVGFVALNNIKKLCKTIASVVNENKQAAKFVFFLGAAKTIDSWCGFRLRTFCKPWGGYDPDNQPVDICYWKVYYYNKKGDCIHTSPTYQEYNTLCKNFLKCEAIVSRWPPCGKALSGLIGVVQEVANELIFNSSHPEYYHHLNHAREAVYKVCGGLSDFIGPLLAGLGIVVTGFIVIGGIAYCICKYKNAKNKKKKKDIILAFRNGEKGKAPNKSEQNDEKRDFPPERTNEKDKEQKTSSSDESYFSDSIEGSIFGLD